MLDDDSPWLAQQRKRWIRPDAQRWLRQDYQRFLPPGCLALKANFDPAQPRDAQGRWTDTGGSDSTSDTGDAAADISGGIANDAGESPILVSGYSFGTLVGQAIIRNGVGGRMCFYRFGFGIVMVPGMTRLGCLGTVPSSTVTHGRLIANDN